MQISLSGIRNVASQAFRQLGISEEDGKIITDSIIFANQRGIETHGIGRLPL